MADRPWLEFLPGYGAPPLTNALNLNGQVLGLGEILHALEKRLEPIVCEGREHRLPGCGGAEWQLPTDPAVGADSPPTDDLLHVHDVLSRQNSEIRRFVGSLVQFVQDGQRRVDDLKPAGYVPCELEHTEIKGILAGPGILAHETTHLQAAEQAVRRAFVHAQAMSEFSNPKGRIVGGEGTQHICRFVDATNKV